MSVVVIPGRAARGLRPTGLVTPNYDVLQEYGIVAWFPSLPLMVDRSTSGAYALTASTGTVGATGCVLGGQAATFSSSALYSTSIPLTAEPMSMAAWASTTVDRKSVV